MICPDCKGEKTVFAHIHRRHGSGFEHINCMRCEGLGEVDDRQAEWMPAGQMHREARIKRQESLLECARRLGIAPVELSAMERGTSDPRRLVETPA